MTFTQDKSVAVRPLRVGGFVAEDSPEKCRGDFHGREGTTGMTTPGFTDHGDDVPAQPLSYFFEVLVRGKEGGFGHGYLVLYNNGSG